MSLKVLALLTISLVLGGSAFAVEPVEAVESDPAHDAIVNKYVSATHEQQTAMRGASMQVDIDAEVPKLQSKGKLQALRNISKLGKITYNALNFIRDKRIKNEVIARYLTAETQTPAGPDISITRANYKFKYKRLQDHEGHQAHAFQVSPTRKQLGLFTGDVWIDPRTHIP